MSDIQHFILNNLYKREKGEGDNTKRYITNNYYYYLNPPIKYLIIKVKTKEWTDDDDYFVNNVKIDSTVIHYARCM